MLKYHGLGVQCPPRVGMKEINPLRLGPYQAASLQRGDIHKTSGASWSIATAVALAIAVRRANTAISIAYGTLLLANLGASCTATFGNQRPMAGGIDSTIEAGVGQLMLIADVGKKRHAFAALAMTISKRIDDVAAAVTSDIM